MSSVLRTSVPGFTAVLSLVSSAALAQPAPLPPLDAVRFAQMKDAKAERVSSSSPDPGSNNDSKQPIPGETLTLADLRGPGVVTHIWLTIAANEYAWPRLMRLRVYYDGNAEPSVDALKNVEDSDRRWLWAAALAVLLIETWIRRDRQRTRGDETTATATTKAEAHEHAA